MIVLVIALCAWTVLLLFVDFFGFYRQTNDPIDRKLNSVSAIVCARNESDNIGKCLDSLIEQNGISFLEIIVVDDHSDDGTAEVIQTYIVKYKTQSITFLQLNDGNGKKEALKLGISKASSDWIYFTDADCTHDPNLLEQFGNGLSKTDKVGMGPVILRECSGILKKIIQVEQVSNMMTTKAFVEAGKPIMANGANLMIHHSLKDNYLKSLQQNTAGGDDVFFIQQLTKSGVSIKWCDKAKVYTESPNDLAEFYNQRLRWASKTTLYKSSMAKFISGFVFVSSVTFMISFILLMLVPSFTISILLFWTFKIVIEFGFHNKWCHRWGIKHNLVNATVLSLLYPFYVCSVAVGTILGIDFYWKGRSYAK